MAYDLNKSLAENVLANPNVPSEQILNELRVLKSTSKLKGGTINEDFKDLEDENKVQEILEGINSFRGGGQGEQAPITETPTPQTSDSNKDYWIRKLAQVGSGAAGGAISGSAGGPWGMGAGALVGGGLAALNDPGPVLSGQNIVNLASGPIGKGISKISQLAQLAQKSPIIGNFISGQLAGTGESALTQGIDAAQDGRSMKDIDVRKALMAGTLRGGLQGATSGMLGHGWNRSGSKALREFEDEVPGRMKPMNLMREEIAATNAEDEISSAGQRLTEQTGALTRMKEVQDQLTKLKADPSAKILRGQEIKALEKELSDLDSVIPKRGIGGKFLSVADRQNPDTLKDVVMDGLYKKYGQGIVKGDDMRRLFANDPVKIKEFVKTKLDNVLNAGLEGPNARGLQEKTSNELADLVKFSNDLTGSPRHMQETIINEYFQRALPILRGEVTQDSGKATNSLTYVLDDISAKVFPGRPEVPGQLKKLATAIDNISEAMSKKAPLTVRANTLNPTKWGAWFGDLMHALRPAEVVDRIVLDKSILPKFLADVQKIERIAKHPLSNDGMIGAMVRSIDNIGREERNQDLNRINLERSILSTKGPN